jgi:hypothetical protein
MVPVVVMLYLNLVYATLTFFLLLIHHGYSSKLHHPAHNHISISHIRLLSPFSTTITGITISEFISWTMNLRK